MTKIKPGVYVLALLIMFFLIRCIWWMVPAVFATWELQTEDQLIRVSHSWLAHHRGSPDIVHVDLDDTAISSLDFASNDPLLYARLIDILSKANVAAVLVDRIFTYSDSSAGSRELKMSMIKSGRVYLPVALKQNLSPEASGTGKSDPPPPALWHIPALGAAAKVISARIVLGNVPELNSAVAGLGHINCWPDRDGVYRRYPLLLKSPKGYVPVLALRLASDYLDVSPETIRIVSGRQLILPDAHFPDGRRADIAIPIDASGRNRINFIGSWPSSFAHYSIQTILDSGSTREGQQELMDQLEETIVIISDVSTAGRDYGPVPFSPYSPLSNLQAHLLNSILMQDFLIEAGVWPNLLLELAVYSGLFFIALATKGYRLVGRCILLLAGLTGLQAYLLNEFQILLNIVRPVLGLMFGTMVVVFLQFFQEQQEKQYIRAKLTTYFAPSVMHTILDEPERLETVTKKTVTILFSDIVGFTSWCTTKEADEIHQLLSTYFQEMATIVFAHEGTIDKYMGDGLMAFFGDPISYPDHALKGVRAARAMQAKVTELRQKWRQEGKLEIMIRIGVHTGEVVVGNMGSRERMEYTVIGSNVNLAQRLESNCPPGSVLVSEQVRAELGDEITTTSAGTIMAKGFDRPIPVFTVQ